MHLASLGAVDWVVLVASAFVVGFAKSAVGSLGTVAVVGFALTLPIRESTGALLPLLICGDLLAVRRYRGHTDWGTLIRLLPGVAVGLLVGSWFLGRADDAILRATIGVIILGMVATTALVRMSEGDAMSHRNPICVPALGVAAGFATMTANAGGPVTTLYLLWARLPVLSFLGTASWLYLVVNLAKLPLSASLHLVTLPSLIVDVALVPAMLLGFALGTLVIRRVNRAHFEAAGLAASAGSGALLLLPSA